MSDCNELSLIQAASIGDNRAFDRLILPYISMIRRITLYTVQRHELVDDLTQEVLLQAYLSLDTLRDHTRFRSWLHGITLNICRVHWRKRQISVISLEVILEELSDTVNFASDGQLEHAELEDTIASALELLSPANREAVSLFYFQDFKLSEAANVLGISVNAFKARLYKARHQLYEQLLPLIDPANQREQTKEQNPVIPFKVINVFSVSELAAQATDVVEVVLYNEQTGHELSIPVSKSEGLSIMQLLTKDEALCPCIPLFLGAFLSAVESCLDSISLSLTKDQPLQAQLNIYTDESITTFDARLGDAIMMAVQMNKPIYILEKALNKDSVRLLAGAIA